MNKDKFICSGAILSENNRYRAPECKGPAKEDVGEGPFKWLPRTYQ